MNTINEIKQKALAAGFSEVGEVPINSLQYSEEIRRICEGNSCRNYGASWACPPAVGSLEECHKRCEQYDTMLLLSRKYELEDAFDFEGMMKGLLHFKSLIEALDDGVKDQLGEYLLLSNEGCGRCKECTYPNEPCRFPDRLYHSIEGYGFEVVKLARTAGISYNNGANTVTYFGAILFHQTVAE